MKNNNQKGVSLLITLLIMGALLSIVIMISRLNLGELQLTRNIPDSAIAYYAAEAGIEKALYDERISGGASNAADCSVSLDNGSSYGLTITRDASGIKIESNGCYKDIRRAIEVSF